MKLAMALGGILLASVVLQGAPRKWQDARVTAISSEVTGAAAASLPVGTTVFTGAAPLRTLYYRIETDDLIYILALTPGRSPLSHPRKPLNVTLHGKTKISIDGTNAHILDDAGKDVKLPIIEKIAK